MHRNSKKKTISKDKVWTWMKTTHGLTIIWETGFVICCGNYNKTISFNGQKKILTKTLRESKDREEHENVTKFPKWYRKGHPTFLHTQLKIHRGKVHSIHEESNQVTMKQCLWETDFGAHSNCQLNFMHMAHGTW